MADPVTAAGRALLEAIESTLKGRVSYSREKVTWMLLAIEAEASAGLRAALEQAAARIEKSKSPVSSDYRDGWLDAIHAIANDPTLAARAAAPVGEGAADEHVYPHHGYFCAEKDCPGYVNLPANRTALLAAVAAPFAPAASDGLPSVERMTFRDPDGSGFCDRCHFPIAVHPLDEHGDDVDRCPDQPQRAKLREEGA